MTRYTQAIEDMITSDDAEARVAFRYRRIGEGRRNDMRQVIAQNLAEEADLEDFALMKHLDVGFDWRAALDEANGISTDEIMQISGMLDDQEGDDQ